MENKLVHVLLTGGIGSRLWPLSRKSRPKQYLEIFENKSLFEKTLLRSKELVDEVIVVGNTDNCHLSRAILEKTNTSYFDIIESTPRNTAAAIAFAAFAADSDSVLLVTPSDHMIDGEKAYKEALDEAVQKAKDGFIVTFGVTPKKPETGYGYIEYEKDDVISFREKPNLETAKDFIRKGGFLWNSGMFCFKAGVFLAELEKYSPIVYKKAKKAWENSGDENSKVCRLDLDLSLDIPSISVDYAVMERSSKIKVVPANFKWSDLGSFESVYEYLVGQGHPVDENRNMVIGSDRFTAFVGMRNTILVCTPDANLILQKRASQDVKEVYNKLDSENSDLLN
ncbi:mannose-1-phosphate guanylyltransferase [Flavicella sediminum]|uniref:mannose-1-phosphate guanylyltransferase n=1 Tax=Flavicella sediminum TaxID=2585141 RepID=UPI00112010CF|nr:sugar phosphate nucleotidyltransferase [Flavicella sediminum]